MGQIVITAKQSRRIRRIARRLNLNAAYFVHHTARVWQLFRRLYLKRRHNTYLQRIRVIGRIRRTTLRQQRRKQQPVRLVIRQQRFRRRGGYVRHNVQQPQPPALEEHHKRRELAAKRRRRSGCQLAFTDRPRFRHTLRVRTRRSRQTGAVTRKYFHRKLSLRAKFVRRRRQRRRRWLRSIGHRWRCGQAPKAPDDEWATVSEMNNVADLKPMRRRGPATYERKHRLASKLEEKGEPEAKSIDKSTEVHELDNEPIAISSDDSDDDQDEELQQILSAISDGDQDATKEDLVSKDRDEELEDDSNNNQSASEAADNAEQHDDDSTAISDETNDRRQLQRILEGEDDSVEDATGNDLVASKVRDSSRYVCVCVF